MQFDRAEPAPPAAPPACMACHQILSGLYYRVQNGILCEACGRALAGASGKSQGSRLLKALLFGAGGVALGGGINWFIAARWDFYHGIFGLLAALIVAFAVRMGSGYRGGRSCQILAVLLSYLAIVAMFLPLLRQDPVTVMRVVRLLWLPVLLPFRAMVEGLLLGLVIAISLYQAWRLNQPLAIDGPFPVGSSLPPRGSSGI